MIVTNTRTHTQVDSSSAVLMFFMTRLLREIYRGGVKQRRSPASRLEKLS